MTHDHLALDGITDIPGIKVGHWTNRRAATGCTVILCPPEGAVGGVDVRGGAPGTRETDLLRPGHLVQRVNAIVLSGGSLFGLEAATGVVRYLEEQGIGDIGAPFGKLCLPVVPAAILFDLGIGSWKVRPDAESGYRAAKAARSKRIAQGSVGAGTGACVAQMAGLERCLKGGVGSACERGPDGLLVGALAAVNAGGDIIDPDRGQPIAAPRADGGGFLDGWVAATTVPAREPAGEHTTLAVVATNARLDKEWTNRLASIAHDGFARTIRPAHRINDGDVIFALATGEVRLDPRVYPVLEALAVRAVERAVMRGVLCATGLAGVPSASEWAERFMP